MVRCGSYTVTPAAPPLVVFRVVQKGAFLRTRKGFYLTLLSETNEAISTYFSIPSLTSAGRILWRISSTSSSESLNSFSGFAGCPSLQATPMNFLIWKFSKCWMAFLLSELTKTGAVLSGKVQAQHCLSVTLAVAFEWNRVKLYRSCKKSRNKLSVFPNKPAADPHWKAPISLFVFVVVFLPLSKKRGQGATVWN